jgi:hypothetical protein
MKKTTEQERARKIDEAMRLVWASLETHLIYTHAGKLIRNETYDFHKKTVIEYVALLKLLSELY